MDLLPLGSLPLNQVQSPKGRWPGDQMLPSKASSQEAVSSPQGCPWGKVLLEEAPGQAGPTWGLPAPFLYRPQSFLLPLENEAVLLTLKEYMSL